MDFKQAIIENAWGGFNMDYGLLHLQLATPLTVLAFILLMIFLLNKLFFQPVLRTLDQRKENIQGSMKQSERLSKELERMQSDFQHKLDETRKNVMEIHHSARDEAFKDREGMILQEREQLEEEMHNQSEMLQQDFASAKQRFNELTKQLSTQVSERLLN